MKDKIKHKATHSILRKYGNDPQTSGAVQPLHTAYCLSLVSQALSQTLVIINGAQLRADISQGLQLLPSL